MIKKPRKKRSIMKAVTWRIIASITTMALVWIFSEDLTLAFSVGILETTSKMLFYYFHERAWASVNWGFVKTTS